MATNPLASLSKGKVRFQTPTCPYKPSSHTHTHTRLELETETVSGLRNSAQGSKGKVRFQTPTCPHKPSSHTHTHTHTHTHAWNWRQKQYQALEIVPRDPYNPGLSTCEPGPGGRPESINRKGRGDQRLVAWKD